VLLFLLEAAAALALVEYVRRELPALGAGAADAARRATRHRDTCELTAIAAEARHRPPTLLSRPRRARSAPLRRFRRWRRHRFRSSRRAVSRPGTAASRKCLLPLARPSVTFTSRVSHTHTRARARAYAHGSSGRGA